jgi:hypothetical protein
MTSLDRLVLSAAVGSFALVCAAGLAAQAQLVDRTPAAIAASQFQVAAAADFDGDGDVDIVGIANFTAGAPRARMLRNDGRGAFMDATAGSLPSLPFSLSQTQRVVALDADGDGDQDVLSTEQFLSRLWRNNGTGVFTDVSSGLPQLAYGFREVLPDDIDGDGDLDLAVVLQTLGGNVSFLVNQGNGTFVWGSTPTPGCLSVALADVDGDGDRDLVLGRWTSLSVWRNDGGLTFVDVSSAWTPGIVFTTTPALAVGDVDRDGRPDVVVADGPGMPDVVLRNTGSQFVVAGSVIAVGQTRALRALDLDADGYVDLVRGHGPGVSVAINDRAGGLVLATGRLAATAGNVFDVVPADFDRDGDPDLLVCESLGTSRLLNNRHRDLQAGVPVRGQAWSLEVWGQPGYAPLPLPAFVAVGLAGLPQPLPLGGLGLLWLDLSLPYVLLPGTVPTATGVATLAVPVPALAVLTGVPLHVQGLVEQVPGPLCFTAGAVVTVQ